MKIDTKLFIAACLGLTFIMSSCKKSEDPAPSHTVANYTVPGFYNGFTNVDHTEATYIVGMMTELSAQIALGTGTSPATVPTPLVRQHLIDLLNNQNSPFTSNTAYNTSGFQIESNCIATSQATIETYIDSLVAVSNAGTAASSGVAGLALGKDATPKRYLLTKNGVNYSQILSKNIMCDLIYYQISTRVSNSSVDNNTTIAGTNYTAMEHNWDLAFGYWSVPDSFPAVKTPVKLWGSYSNQVDAGLGCNAIVMNAFLKGRAAISNKDMTTRQAQADIILAEFDLMMAGAVVQELNEIQTAYNAADPVKVVSALSECKGFVESMKNNKNPKRIITDAQIDTLLSYIPTNLWDAQQADFDKIRAYICNVYGFTATQSTTL